MPVIIDGYNVLHTTMPQSLAGLDEAGLCDALGRSAWRGQRIVVVFDGSGHPISPAESPVEGIELRYAGRNRSADDVLMQLIESDSAPRRLIVVSSDRQIQKAAHRRRAKVLSSEDLIRVLTTPSTMAGDPVGRTITGPLHKSEVDRWLQRFGFTPEGEDEDEDHKSSGRRK